MTGKGENHIWRIADKYEEFLPLPEELTDPGIEWASHGTFCSAFDNLDSSSSASPNMHTKTIKRYFRR